MVNYTLTAKSPLDGYRCEQDGIIFREVTNYTTLSLGAFKGCEKKLEASIREKLNISLPKPGKVSTIGDLSISSVAREQWFMRFPEKSGDIANEAAADLCEMAAVTDQSDSWVELEVSGPNVREKLAHLCPIDLHSTVFPIDSVARTIMEHLGVIIMRLSDETNGNSRFLILSPRSSAKSFIHMLG